MLVVGALLLSSAGEARAQTATRTLAATDFLRDYVDHAHAYTDLAPLVPRFTDASPWTRIKEALMPNRNAHALYLLGDDRIHMFPTKVGVLGWGMCAGLEF